MTEPNAKPTLRVVNKETGETKTKPYTLRLLDNQTGREFVAALDLTPEGIAAMVQQMMRWAGVPDDASDCFFDDWPPVSS